MPRGVQLKALTLLYTIKKYRSRPIRLTHAAYEQASYKVGHLSINFAQAYCTPT